LMSKGRVTSASLLANGVAFEDAVRHIRDFHHCSFGVHLNITEGFPLTSNAHLGVILGPHGSFNGDEIRRVAIKEPLRKAILEEWTAQVEKVLRRGIPISHFDGHHHIHTIPGLFTTLKQLQKRFSVRRVRITMNIYPHGSPAPLSRLVLKALWNFALRNYYRTQTTEGFTSLEIFMEAAKSKLLSRLVELMVHPGSKDSEAETLLVSSEWWKRLPFTIQHISYYDL